MRLINSHRSETTARKKAKNLVLRFVHCLERAHLLCACFSCNAPVIIVQANRTHEKATKTQRKYTPIKPPHQ